MGSEQVSEQDKSSGIKKVMAVSKLDGIGRRLEQVIELLEESGADEEDINDLKACMKTTDQAKEKYQDRFGVKKHN